MTDTAQAATDLAALIDRIPDSSHITVPKDLLRAVLADRERLAAELDVASRQRDYAVDANRVLIDSAKRADQRAEVAQFVLDQCRARIATLELELASLTEPTEYGRPGVQWTWGELEDGEARTHDYAIPETQARTWASESPYGVLLRREHTAWHRWPLDEAEADRMSADAARFRATEPSCHDSPQCAPAGGGCACQGGGA